MLNLTGDGLLVVAHAVLFGRFSRVDGGDHWLVFLVLGHLRRIILAMCASLLSSRVLQCDSLLHKTDQSTHMLLHFSFGILHVHI